MLHFHKNEVEIKKTTHGSIHLVKKKLRKDRTNEFGCYKADGNGIKRTGK